MVAIVLFFVIFSFFFSFFGCSKKDVKEQSFESIEEIVIGTPEDQITLDQQAEGGATGWAMKQLLYNGLVDLTKDLKIVPSLAEKWEVSEDGKEYTFYLRRGVMFHNGREMKAEDVKFSFERALKPETACQWLDNVSIIKDMKIIDEYTIKMTLEKPYAPFLYGIASGQRPIVAKESYNDDNTILTPIGTGPYKFVKWEPDNYFILEAFEGYWAGTPTVKKITFKVISDETVRLTALKTGEADIILSPPENILIKEISNPSSEDYRLSINEGSLQWAYAFGMNQEFEPFKDIRVRKAILYAIDPNAIIETVFHGQAAVATELWPRGNVWYMDIDRPKPDIAKARELLEEAGYSNGFEFNISTTNVLKLDKIAEIIQSQLTKIGLNAKLEIDEFATFIDRETNMDFDAHMLANNLFLDPEIIWSIVLKTGGAFNQWYMNYNNTEIDALLDKAAISNDFNYRKKLYEQVTSLIWEDVPIVWLVNTPFSYGYRTYLKGVEFNGRNDFIFDNNKGIPFLTK